MTRPNLDPLVQEYRQAATNLEEFATSGQQSQPGGAEELTRLTNASRTAEQRINRALPTGTTLANVIGETPNTPTSAPAAAPGNIAAPANSATGTNRYLQRVLEAHRLGNFNFNIQENSLNEQDRYTYHVGLYLVSDTDARKPDIGNLVYTNQVPMFVLVKSGVTTGFNITSLEIRDSVSSSFRSRNNVTTEINMTILEPYGMTLVDKMYNASQQLGVQNWRMAPIILTLEIRSLKSDGTPGATNQVQKFYSVIITDMDGTLVSTGTTYRIRAMVQNTLGFTDQYYMLPTNLTLKVGAGGITPGTVVRAQPSPGNTPVTALPAPEYTLDGTVGQFFSVIGQVMSDFYMSTRLQGTDRATTPVVLYEFTIDETLAQQRINMSAFSNRRRGSFSSSNTNTQEIHVNRLGISELVDDILSSIMEPEFFTANTQVGTIRIPRIECVVQYVGWDNLLNDYIKKFIFSIGIMETVRPVPTVAHGEYFQLNAANARTRLEGMRNIIRKAYPYLYTGMNTEILNLELTFNHLHIIPLPLHNGRTITPSGEGQSLAVREQELQRQLRAENTQATALEQEQLTNLQSRNRLRTGALTNIPDAQVNQNIQLGLAEGLTPQAVAESQITSLDARRSEIGDTITSGGSRIERLESELSTIRGESLVLFEPENVPFALRSRATTSPEAIARARQTAQTQAQQRAPGAIAARGRSSFVEDVSTQTREPGRLSYAASPQDIANNLARPANVQDDAQNDVRGIYSTILQQMYDRVGLQLTEIEMEIRGDPYWLGESNLERVTKITEYLRTRGVAAGAGAATSAAPASGVPASFARAAGLDTDALYADYYTKDAAFLLLFRAGNAPSETTGYMNFDTGSRENQSVFFNGVYIALEVTHMFDNGKFTQKIRAVRDALTNLETATQAAGTVPSAATGAATPVAAAPSPRPATNGNAPAAGGAPAPAGGAPAPAPAAGSSSPVVTNPAAAPTTTPAQPPSPEPSPQPVARSFVTPTPLPGESAAQFGARLGAAIRQQRAGGGAPALPLTQSE
jgi:hypothetical protein